MRKIMYKFELLREELKPIEEWKWIEGYEGLYEISNYGNVRNNFKQRIRTFETKRGMMVKLKRDGFSELFIVPLLVYMAFYRDSIAITLSARVSDIIRDDNSRCKHKLF